MPETLFLALACTLVAALPLWVSGRKTLLNPAFFVFLMVLWSVSLKTLYLALFHAEPLRRGHDRVYLGAESADVLIAGALLLLAALTSYVGGFFLFGGRRPGFERLRRIAPELPPAGGRRAIAVLGLMALGAFLFYLAVAGETVVELGLSAKRFRPGDIGVDSRFEYWPYYFFKLALLSGSLAYVAVFFLAGAENRRQERSRRWIFGAVFLLALVLAHYASLRLFILLVLLQVALLVHYLRAHRLRVLVTTIASLTVASFVSITYFHRAQSAPEEQDAAPVVAAAPVAAGEPSPSEKSDEPAAATVADPGAVAETSPSEEEIGSSPAASDPTAPPEASRPRPKKRRLKLPSLVDLGRSLGRSSFDGRYFLDVAKVAHLAHAFPAREPYPGMRALLGRSGDDAGDNGSRATASLGKYLAVEVFEEPNNNIPAGYTGELYLSFGPPAVVLGFLALGAFHRWLLNLLADRRLPLMIACCLVVLIPNTTIVLLNSNLLAATVRSILDVGVIVIFWKLAELFAMRRSLSPRSSH